MVFMYIFQKLLLKTSMRNYRCWILKNLKRKSKLFGHVIDHAHYCSEIVASVSLYQNTDPTKYEISSECFEALQLAGEIGVHWLVLVLLWIKYSSGERLIPTVFTRRLLVATYWTLKRLTVCSLSDGNFEPNDFSIKQGVAGQVMQL